MYIVPSWNFPLSLSANKKISQLSCGLEKTHSSNFEDACWLMGKRQKVFLRCCTFTFFWFVKGYIYGSLWTEGAKKRYRWNGLQPVQRDKKLWLLSQSFQCVHSCKRTSKSDNKLLVFHIIKCKPLKREEKYVIRSAYKQYRTNEMGLNKKGFI